MAVYLGDFVEDDADLTFYWNTNDADGASITRATDGTVKLIRDDATDCTAGSITDSENSPLTGIHKCVVDLSGNAGCVVAHDYMVYVDGAVIDGETVNAALAHFSIENRFREVDLTKILGTAVAESTGANIATNFNTFFDDGDDASSTAIMSYIEELATANLPTDIGVIKAITDDMKVLDTTIASVDTPDTVFRVNAGLTGNDDINNAVCSIRDTTGGVWSGPRRVTDYVHATLQITIDANTAFPLAAGDRVVIWNVSYATTAAAGSITQGDLDDIADAVWEELMADHLTELTTGAKQNVSDRVGR